jgi:hypothetical protein
MGILACDPHDGRIYQGSLAPTVGPLSLHCGPGLAVKGCHVLGCGEMHHARVDLPIAGSRYVRARVRRGHHHVHGHIPYAISVTHLAPTRELALHGAIVGAMIVGDASEMTTATDRYKLLALQHAMAGATPGQVHDMLVQTLHADLYNAAAAAGVHPEVHSKDLLAEAMGPDHVIVGGFLSDIGHIAGKIVSDVGKVASAVTKTAGPWVGDVLHGVQAAVSVVPGLGTAVSDVVAAAETAYESAAALASGNPLAAGLHAAYNFATASVPGASALRPILDPVVNTLINLAAKKEPIDSAVLDGLLASVPDSPSIGSLSPRSVAASFHDKSIASPMPEWTRYPSWPRSAGRWTCCGLLSVTPLTTHGGRTTAARWQNCSTHWASITRSWAMKKNALVTAANSPGSRDFLKR